MNTPTQFTLAFTAVYSGDEFTIAELESSLKVLSKQVLTARLPAERLDEPSQRISANGLHTFLGAGALEITFEDDVDGDLQRALDMITSRKIYHLQIIVLKLNQHGDVSEGMVYGDNMLLSMQHSNLSYEDGPCVTKVLTLRPSYGERGHFGGKTIAEVLKQLED